MVIRHGTGSISFVGGLCWVHAQGTQAIPPDVGLVRTTLRPPPSDGVRHDGGPPQPCDPPTTELDQQPAHQSPNPIP
jgi:hypothetical protein